MVNRVSEWSWAVDAEAGVNSVRMSGVITSADILSALGDLAAHKSFDPSFGLVLDFSLASDLQLTAVDAQTIVRHHPAALSAPHAVVGKSVIGAALAHAYCAVCDRLTGTGVVHVCGSMREAREWLSARPDRLRRPAR
jgi:hypothetical protein